MNRAIVTVLALRLLAVYAWFQAFGEASRGLAFWSAFKGNTADFDPLAAVLASTVAYVVCGILLFMWAVPLSRRMFPVEPDAPLKNHAEIGGLALRIFGIVLWTWAIEWVPSALVRGLVGDSLGSIALFTTLVLLVVMGTWLFVRGNSIAVWLLRTPPATGGRSLEQVQAIAIAVAGLVVFATGLPDGIAVLVRWITRRFGDESQMSTLARYAWPASFAPIARVVIGLSLFVGSSGIAYFWHRARTAGLTPNTPHPDHDPV